MISMPTLQLATAQVALELPDYPVCLHLLDRYLEVGDGPKADILKVLVNYAALGACWPGCPAGDIADHDFDVFKFGRAVARHLRAEPHQHQLAKFADEVFAKVLSVVEPPTPADSKLALGNSGGPTAAPPSTPSASSSPPSFEATPGSGGR